MKFFSKILANTLILSLLFGSFIFAPSLLNESNIYKQFWFEFLITGFSIISIISLWMKKSFKFQFNLIDVVIGLLLINYLIIVIVSSPNSFISRPLVYYGLFYFVLKLLFENLKPIEIDCYKRVLLIVVPFVIMTHILVVFVQQTDLSPFLKRTSPIGSTFGNPDMLGAYMATLLPFCFMQNRSKHFIGYSVSFFCLSTLVILQARSAILAILICGFVWLIVNKMMKFKVIIFAIIVIILILFLLIFWHPESVFGRLFVWFTSLKMITQKPFGWGLTSFEKHYPEFQASYISAHNAIPDLISPEVVHSPFNELLNIGVTIGIQGFLLFTLLLGLIFYHGNKLESRLLYPLVVFFVISLFFFPFKIAPLVCVILPIVALVSSRAKTPLQFKPPVRFIKLNLTILLILSCYMVFTSISNLNIYKKWGRAYALSFNESSYLESDRLFSALYPRLKSDGRFLMTYSELKLAMGNNHEALELLEEAQNYYCDISLSLKLAKQYEIQGLFEKAREKYDLAINLAPKQMGATYEKILFLQNIGEYEEAYDASLEVLKRPYQVSSFADPYIINYQLKKFILDYEKSNLK